MPKLEIEKIMQQINAVAEAEEEQICKLLKTLPFMLHGRSLVTHESRISNCRESAD